MKRPSFNPAQVPDSISLDSVRVASPCHADWDKMRGDDRSRFCPSCAKNVYNLSSMTSVEAQSLLQEKEGRLCVRFFQREDGTMLTQDCPVGVASLKERSPSFALWAGVASLVLLAAALLSPTFLSSAQAQPEPRPGDAASQAAMPTPEPSVVTMGDVGPTAHPTPEATPVASPIRVPFVPLMGKPMVPRATPTHEVKGEIAAPQPTPHEHSMVLGRVALRPTPVPTPTAPKPVMGSISPAPRVKVSGIQGKGGAKRRAPSSNRR